MNDPSVIGWVECADHASLAVHIRLRNRTAPARQFCAACGIRHATWIISPCTRASQSHHATRNTTIQPIPCNSRPQYHTAPAQTYGKRAHGTLSPTPACAQPHLVILGPSGLPQRRLAERTAAERSEPHWVQPSGVGRTCAPGCAAVRTGCRSRGRPVVPEVNNDDSPREESRATATATVHQRVRPTVATKREGKSGSAVAQREGGSLLRRVGRRLWLGSPARCGCGRMHRRVCGGGCRLLPCTFRAGGGAGAGAVVDVLRVAYLLQSRRGQNVKIEKDDAPGRRVFLV